MKVLGKTDEIELTIVSRRLLRVSADEWAAPHTLFMRLQGAALAALTDAYRTSTNRELNLRVLLMLDCMLRVVDEPVLSSVLAFATPRFRSIQRLFYGALGSERFISVASATRQVWAYTFCQLMTRLGAVTSVATFNHRQRLTADIPTAFVEEFDSVPLNSVEIKLLRPYLLVSKSGDEYNVLLAPLLNNLGDQFTEAFHQGLRAIARPKAKDSALRDFGSTFARFVEHRVKMGDVLTPEQLRDGDFVQTFVVEFMEFHFMKMMRRETPVQEGTLLSLQKLWSRYQRFWGKLVAAGVLASPSSAFPEGNPRLLADDAVGHRRVVDKPDGTSTVVTQKLIVSVPLHLTDEEATQLLFQQLKADFSLVQSWLSNHLNGLFSAAKKGQALAAAYADLPSDAAWRKLFQESRDEQESIALAVSYFKSVHGGYIDTSKHETLPYPSKAARDCPSKRAVARYLGLPLRRDALALMAYLASQDGRFSESALSACFLLDRNGTRINAVETDGGITLSVLKERDATDGWHNVALKGEAATYVRQWIDVTEPLRTYMQENSISGWRNLFIYTGNPLGSPSHFNRATNLYNSFRTLALSAKDRLGDLAEQVTIPRIRSTRGVLVFLETMDLAAMARELGNTSDTSLRHYLPDSLWDYFATRWLRIFQNLLIVEATKGTPYMQRALQFNSASEMDEFLQNHAIRSLLPPDESTATAPDSQEVSELMVPASPGLFATLLSITAATDQAASRGRSVAPQALYWSEFTKRVQAHIASDKFHDRGIKSMMVDALKNVCPDNFAEVVCA